MLGRKILRIAFSFVLFAATVSHAERPKADNLMQWLAFMGPIGFSDAGEAYLPETALLALRGGDISPTMQMVLQAHMMASCVEEVLERSPSQRTSYVQAAKMFSDGICRIRKCFETGMIMDVMSQMSKSGTAGQAHQQQAAMLLQAFSNDKCSGGGGGFDPALLFLITGNR